VTTFGRVLLLAWLILGLTVALAFAFPKSASHLLHPVAPYFQLIPISLLIGTVAYVLLRVYRFGMKRSTLSR
jgi:hypothetical protein